MLIIETILLYISLLFKTFPNNNLINTDKEGKKKESSFNGLDFEHMQFFMFFVRLIKKWSNTKLLQIEIVTHFYE